MKKKILFSIICFLMIFTLTGCSNKTVLTTNDFKTKVEEEGYTISDGLVLLGSNEHIKESVTATSKDGYDVVFYIYDEIDNAKNEFEKIKSDFQTDKGGGAIQIMNSVKNYSTYSLQSNGTYKYVCRVDNTLLVVKVDEKYKDTIKELIKKLGY